MGALDDAVAALQHGRNPSGRRPRSRRSTSCSAATGGSSADWSRLLDPAAFRAGRSYWHASSTASRRPRRRPLPTARGIDEAGPEAPPTYFLRRGELHRAGAGRRAGVPDGAGDVGVGRSADRAVGRFDRAPSGAGRLADAARPSADGAGDGQPALAGAFRPRTGRHVQRLRHDGRRAQPSRAARLAGDRAGRAGLEPQVDAPADRHQRDVSAVVAATSAGRVRGRPGEPLALRPESPAARRRDDPRRHAGGFRAG